MRALTLGIVIALAVGLATPALADKPIRLKPGAVATRCRGYPITRFAIGLDETRFGALLFRGGLELDCSGGLFGGISGLAIEADGQTFLMVSDAGLWVTGRFVEEAGRLTGIADAAVAPMLGTSGRALVATHRGDTESLALTAGVATVGIEQANEIVSFDFGKDGVMARARSVPVPPAAKELPFNRGFEALGVVPAALPAGGAIIAISERSSETGPTTQGFLIGGTMPGVIAVRRSEGFDVTDLAFLPDGDMLLLERRFSLLRGIAMRIRRVAGADIVPGATLDGAVLMEASPGVQIDNMEALAISRSANGETLLTIMSDDNYSFFQRSLVLRFALPADAPSATR